MNKAIDFNPAASAENSYADAFEKALAAYEE